MSVTYSFIYLFISIYIHAAYIFNIRKIMMRWGTTAAKAQKSYISMNINWIVLVWNRAEIKYKYYMENQKNNKITTL